ncbi:MAG: hypothetical protein AAGD06_30400 [Acidobacteriota bacterium]
MHPALPEDPRGAAGRRPRGIDPRPARRPRRLPPALVSVACVAWILASAAWGATGAPAIQKLGASGTDLVVDLFRGLPAPTGGGLEVVVSSPRCGELGRVFVPTLSNTAAASLQGVLAGHLTCGPYYKAHLEDAAGVVGRVLPFRVGVSCGGTFLCSYVVEPGISVHRALVTSAALDSALETVGGSGDLAAAVSAGWPGLRDEVLSHVLYLGRLPAGQGIGSGTSPCTCVPSGTLQRSSSSYTGASHRISALACTAYPIDGRSGVTVFATGLRCYGPGTGIPITFQLPGGVSHTVASYDFCAPPVDLPAQHYVQFTGRVVVGGDLGHGAKASLGLTVHFDGQQFVGTSVQVDRTPSSSATGLLQPLVVGAGPVLASTTTVGSTSMAEVTPTSLGPPPPSLGARATGDLGLGAYGASWRIDIGGPITDSPEDGQDPAVCLALDRHPD